MENNNIEKKKKKNDKVYLLSLDGGGVRGVASAQFLYRLEEKMGKPMHEVFDVFTGTSTGGIIALGMGVMKYSTKDVLELYSLENLRKIMPPPTGWFYDYNPLAQLRVYSPKFDGVGKTEVLKHHFGEKKFSDTDKVVVVTSYDVESREARIWKNKHHFDIDPSSLLIYQLADATSAAPTYFPTVPVECLYNVQEEVKSHSDNLGIKPEGEEEAKNIDPNLYNKKTIWSIDGGVIANNPVMCGYAEVCKQYPEALGNVVVLSVGTGHKLAAISGPLSRTWGSIAWMRNGFLDIVMDTSVVDYQAKHMLSLNAERYLRVNSDVQIKNHDGKILINASEELDAVSEANIDQLKKLGDYWFDQFGEAALNMLKSA